MDTQHRVAAFVETHELEAPPEFRILDLVSEVGEVAKAAADSTGYGTTPDSLAVPSDEIGDVVFALLALAESLDVDAETALDEALEKYERRIERRDTPSSGPGESDGRPDRR